MKTILAALALVPALAFATSDAKLKNDACIQKMVRYRFIPADYEIVTLDSGEILTIYAGKKGALSITRGVPDRNEYYTSYSLDGRNCSSNITSENGSTYLGSGLAKYVAGPGTKIEVINEVKAACRMAPAFAGQIREFEAIQSRSTNSSDSGARN